MSNVSCASLQQKGSKLFPDGPVAFPLCRTNMYVCMKHCYESVSNHYSSEPFFLVEFVKYAPTLILLMYQADDEVGRPKKWIPSAFFHRVMMTYYIAE